MIRAFGFGPLLMLGLMACSPVYPTVLFPAPGALLVNPVRLETTEAVTWSIDGRTVGSGRMWRGNLDSGPHTVTASSAFAAFEFSIRVQEPFPKGVVRSLNQTDLEAGRLELPGGEYWVLLGNTKTSKQTLNLPALNLSASTGTPRQASTWSDGSDWSNDIGLLEHFAERTNALLAAGVQPLSNRSIGRVLKASEVPTQRTFNVLDLTGTGSTQVNTSLHYSGSHVLAYVENGLEPSTLNAIAGIAAQFENRIYDIDVNTFGPAADVDNNGRVILLFTPKLNQSKQAIGFFYQGDMLERNRDNPDSNQADILYLGVPVSGDANFSVASLEATSCHEFQHLIHFSRKTLPRLADALPVEEGVAINEGLSHLAEDLCGYNLKGGNLAFVARFLEHPEQISLDGLSMAGKSDSIERRGAMYLFLRFVYERFGSAFIKPLIASSESGLENVATTVHQPLDALLWRWWWAMALKSGSKFGAVQGFDHVTLHGVTGDIAGVNLWAGRLEVIPGFEIALNGPHSVEAWPSSIPPRATIFRQVTGPKSLQIPTGAELNVLRLK